jgi:hypothetical protein
VLANSQWKTVQEEDSQNRELLQLSHQILELTKAVHAYAAARADGEPGTTQQIGGSADAPGPADEDDSGTRTRRSM